MRNGANTRRRFIVKVVKKYKEIGDIDIYASPMSYVKASTFLRNKRIYRRLSLQRTEEFVWSGKSNGKLLSLVVVQGG